MDEKTELSREKPTIGNQPDGQTVADWTPAETKQRTIELPGEAVPVAPELEALRAGEDAVAAEWSEGDILLDLYEVRGVLGEGGMGKVYRVHHRAWNLDLAVKSPRPETIAQAGGRDNFVREAETWVDLGLHPHTVSCYYVRTLGGIPRVFAELVEGGSLADWIRTRKLYEGGPEKALERILDIAIQFAWGLHHAHEQGLIHQDVKPANVMMTPDGTAKVTDFGLAKARGAAGERSGAIQGGSVLVSAGGMTPAYCSPEQAARQPLSRKTDIWSWGLSVLEMFTGEVTWLAGQAAAEALENYLEMGTEAAAFPPMPKQLAGLLKQCFAQEPEARPKDMRAVADRLQELYRESSAKPYGRAEPKAAELLADGLNNQAVSLLDLRRQEKAEELFKQALQLDPHHLEATYNWGLHLWRSARMTDEVLVRQLEEVRTTHEGDWRDEYYLGLVHMERGDAESALGVLEQASRQAPQEEEIRLVLSAVCNAQAKWRSYVRTLQGHTDLVNSVAISPDGRWGLSGSVDKSLRLWELATGRCVRIFEGHTEKVWSVAISPDSRWGVSGSDDKTLRLWELATGRCLGTLEGHLERVTSVAISPDGRWGLSGSEDNTLRLWELATGQCVRNFEGHAKHVWSVALSADGRWGLSGSLDKTMRLWELATGRCVRTFEGHKDGVVSVAISADGRWGLSGCWDKTMRLWELATGRCVRTFEGHRNAVHSVAISADGRWGLSGSSDMTMRLWELATGRCVRTFERHKDGVVSAAISPDGRWALSGSWDKTLRLWELKGTGPAAARAVTIPRTGVEVTQLATVVREAIGKAQSALRQGLISEAAAEVSRARRLPEYERDAGLLALWRQVGLHGKCSGFSGGWLLRTLQGHTGGSHTGVTSVAISADGRWGLSGSSDRTLRLWDLAAGQCLRTLKGHTWQVTSVAISPDGRWALSGSGDYTLRFWELATGRCVRTFAGHTNAVTSVAISPDGRWAMSGSLDEKLRLWELATGQCVRTFEGHMGWVQSVAISPDGRWALSGSRDKTLRLWELAMGRCVRTFAGHTQAVISVAISADGRWVLSGSEDCKLRLWELATGRCVRTFAEHPGGVNSIAFSPDGRWALSGSWDETLRLWELATGRCVRTFEGHTQAVHSVAISPDGRWALSGSDDMTLRLWELVWEYEFPDVAAWDEDARPHLENFLSVHTPYASFLPPDRTPSEEEIHQVPTRRGRPTWTDGDFEQLLCRLACVGYGWLRPAGVRKKLEEMAATWAASSRKDALATVLQAQEELAGPKQNPRPSPLPTMAAPPPAREGAREQVGAQQALLLKKIVEQLEARRQPGVAQQPRAGSLGKPKSQPAPTPRLLPQKKAAAHRARAKKSRGIAWRLPNAGLTFKLAWLAGWLVLVLDQVAGTFFSSHFLPASEFRIPIDRCWDAGALGAAAILLLMIAPFVIERVAAGRKGR